MNEDHNMQPLPVASKPGTTQPRSAPHGPVIHLPELIENTLHAMNMSCLTVDHTTATAAEAEMAQNWYVDNPLDAMHLACFN